METMKSHRSLVTKLFCLGFFVCFLLNAVATKAEEPKKIVRYKITIDYEGEKIRPENVAATLAFREAHPDVPFIHLLNPASWTAPGADKEETTRLIKSMINPKIDEIGLHIHSRQDLIETTSVPLRTQPAYLGDADPAWVDMAEKKNLMPWQEPLPQTEPSTGRFGSIGDDVPFWAYTKKEQIEIFEKSLQILRENGFAEFKINSFRAGGWSASPATWEALRAVGIEIDTSAAPADILLKGEWKNSYLLHFNRRIWSGINNTSQPYKVHLATGQTILEFPNNGGLADYQNGRDFLRTLIATVQEHKTAESSIVHIGFHHETAAKYLNRVSDGINLMKAYAAKNNIQLIPTTFEGLRKTKVAWAPTRNLGGARTCNSNHK